MNKHVWLMLLMLSSFPGESRADGTVPLYVDSQAIKERFGSITPEDMDMLRSKKILLASRSFGLNTCNGLQALARKDKQYDLMGSFQRFNVFAAGGDVSIVPADIFSKVNFVHVLATYYPWSARLKEVRTMLSDEPRQFGRKVDAVVIFYHTAGPAFFDTYASAMDALRADFPSVRFIYVTAGFMGPSKVKENEASHEFSEKVRKRYMGKVPLYDMGKILSDDFRAGHAYCPEYSKDPADVHPNLDAGQTMLAKGLLLVLRDAFKGSPGVDVTLEPVKRVGGASATVETIPLNHPDARAVRAILDANGLVRKTVAGVSVVEKGRIVGLYLQESGIGTLTADIGKLDALRLLHLYGDRKLSLPLLKTISPELGRCVNLEELLLTQNDLITLPVAITNLQKLKILSLGDNHLKGLDPAVLKWATRFDPKGVALQ